MAGDVQSDAYLGQADPTTEASIYNALAFMVGQLMNGNWTVTLGQVKSVTGGSIDGPATVNVQPMVSEVDGYGNATPHGIINNIPAFRLQGGANGVVADPAEGDIGILAFASRDISSVIANKAPANPGSFRTFDPADGMFIGGMLGKALTQYLNFTTDGLELKDKNGFSLVTSASGYTLTDGNGNVLQTGAGGIAVTVAGDFVVNGISVLLHTHAVTTAPGETGPPVG